VTDLPTPPAPERPTVPAPPGPAIPAPPPAAVETEPATVRRSRRPLVIGLLLIAALVGAVAAVWAWLAAPPPCDGRNVTSERFGYCLSAPEGWRAADAAGQPTDELFRPDGATTLTVQAVRTTADLQTYASLVREGQADAELHPGDVTTTTIDGVQALAWDLDAPSERDPIRARTVVFVSDGVGWRVQFADLTDAFAGHRAELGAILRSWRFR
jgi:hypothetical protein